MASFQYIGRNRSGEKVQGRLEADDQGMVANHLMMDGITPVSITPAVESSNKNKQGKSGEIRIRFLEKVSIDELIIFSRQMYSLSKAGVPVTKAMRGLAGTIRNPLLQESLTSIAEELEKGNALSTAMKRHPKLFNELYISIIHIGENTGQLDISFKQMASYLALERETIKNVKSATRYPTFVLVAIGLALSVINIFVIPAFKNVFASFGGELPWQTEVLIAVSDFSVAWWHAILGGLVIAYLLFKKWKKTDAGELKWDQVILKFPLIGGILFRTVMGRFSRTFSITLKAGVPIEQGLSIVAQAVGNRYIGQKVAGMRQGIERGESFTQTAYRTQMFSPLVMQMLAVGEETGRIDQMLEESADFYEQEVEYDLKTLASAIEPIMIIAIAGMVLVLALGVFLPLWELSSAINR